MNLQNNKLNEVGHMIAHDSHLNQNTDPEKESLIDKDMTKLNQNLFERNDGLTDKEFVEKAVKESPTAEHWKKNYNALSTWCIQIPKEFSGSYEERNEIFKEIVKFTADRYGRDNIVSAWTHFDEVRNREGIEKDGSKSLIPIKEREHCQDHIHIRFLPRTEDGRFSTKEVTPRKELRDFQRDMQQHLREKFPEHAHELNFLNGATKDKSKDLARQAEINHHKNLEEKEQLKKELEKDISEQKNEIFDSAMNNSKKEQELRIKQVGLNAREEKIAKKENELEQIRTAYENAKSIKNRNIEMPEPDGKGLKKGTYSKEQVEKLVNETNRAYEQIRDLQQGREVQRGLDDIMENTRKANEIIRQRTYEKLLQENQELKKDKRTMDWIRNQNPEKAKDWEKRAEKEEKDREKEIERQQHKEHHRGHSR